jgi:rubrerythrin
MSPIDQEVLDGLKLGITQELQAYVFYKKCIGITAEERVRDMLMKLAAEEKDHYRILEKQYDSLVRSEMWNTYTDILRQEGLPDIDEKMGEVNAEFIDEVNDTTSQMRILEIGLTLEKKAVELYSDLEKKTDNIKGKETFAYLKRFEKTHITKIQKMMDEIK